MVETIIKTAIGYIIPAVFGFLIAKLTSYRKKNNSIKIAIMTILQSNISNTFFLYDPIKKIPDYLYKNILNQDKSYKALGGNDYIEAIMQKMKKWEIIRTDILHDKPQI
jgi:hypothetical protein